MNEFETEEQTIMQASDGEPSEGAENVELVENEQELVEAPIATESEVPSDAREYTPKLKRQRRENKRVRSRGTKRPAVFKRIVLVAWSGEREPASDLLWAEASADGEWIIIEKLERIRTRKEVLERILELDGGLVALDFNFSFPAPFFELLASEGIADWRSMVRTVREDLKKNVDDGARLWLERMGRYREAYLDTSMPRPRRGREDRGWNFEKKEPAPYELQSRAERFRRTDQPLIPLAGANMLSTLQIGYNRLTERYEFNGNSRGRGSLLGMSMLGQLLEAGRDDLSIWPMMELKRLTIVETLPWLFTEGKRFEANELSSRLANYEDAGWDIPDDIKRTAAKNPNAQQTLLTLLGILKTEQRLLRNRFPIRFYSPHLYQDPQVQLEGWTYGINYRVHTNGSDAKDTSESDNSLRLIASES